VNSRFIFEFSESQKKNKFTSLQRDLQIWVPAMTILYVEAVARVIKNELFEKMRSKMKQFKLPLEAPYRKVKLCSPLRFFSFSLFECFLHLFSLTFFSSACHQRAKPILCLGFGGADGNRSKWEMA
jgi:hypothetical protein